MPQPQLVRISLVASLITLLLFTGTAIASTSNKWRLECSGNAESAGTIVLEITPKDADSLTVEVPIEDGTGENSVAKQIVKTLKEQLPKDGYHVERDDGEDVLVKKRRGAANFELKVVSNSVKGVRLNLDKE